MELKSVLGKACNLLLNYQSIKDISNTAENKNDLQAHL